MRRGGDEVTENKCAHADGKERSEGQHEAQPYASARHVEDRQRGDRDRVAQCTAGARVDAGEARADQQLDAHGVVGVQRAHSERAPPAEEQQHQRERLVVRRPSVGGVAEEEARVAGAPRVQPREQLVDAAEPLAREDVAVRREVALYSRRRRVRLEAEEQPRGERGERVGEQRELAHVEHALERGRRCCEERDAPRGGDGDEVLRDDEHGERERRLVGARAADERELRDGDARLADGGGAEPREDERVCERRGGAHEEAEAKRNERRARAFAEGREQHDPTVRAVPHGAPQQRRRHAHQDGRDAEQRVRDRVHPQVLERGLGRGKRFFGEMAADADADGEHKRERTGRGAGGGVGVERVRRGLRLLHGRGGGGGAQWAAAENPAAGSEGRREGRRRGGEKEWVDALEGKVALVGR
mmetsp:Transcript_20195/g.48454  ORF Transcript_20195/g.48454 Transcript_20195/m.48454 type:complete len:416 (+) Transcript_20195:526-1773(+)